MDVLLDLLAQSYEGRNKSHDFQVTLNMYPEQSISETGALCSFPGKTLHVPTLSSDRGMYDFEGVYLQVCSTTLYSINMNTGLRTTIGTIVGTSRCTFASNAGLCVIANGEGMVYLYNGTTLSVISDVDLETPYFVSHLNNQWIYSNNGTTGRWGVSNAGDPSSIDGLNYATAESAGDKLNRVYTFRQQLFLFGTRTIEPWWNTGSGNPPFDRQEGGIIEKGLGANYSIAHSDESLYFLGDDRRIYKMTNNQIQPITTDGLWYTIKQYSTVSDAVGYVLQIGNQDIYIIDFPTANRTWAYSQQYDFWFQLSSGVNYGKYNISGAVYYQGDWYVSESDGGIYKLDYTNYTENSSTFMRGRITRSFDSKYFNDVDKDVYWNSVRIRAVVGTGVVDTTPQLMVSFSDNDGQTWSEEYWLDLGELGEYDNILEIHGLGSAYRRKFKLLCTDNVDLSLYDMSADVEFGI